MVADEQRAVRRPRSNAGIAAVAGLLAIAVAWTGRDRPGLVEHRPPPTLVVDPNTATAGVLSCLPRVGPSLAAAIVRVRAERPFRSLADFDARVPRVGPSTLAALEPHFVFPSSPAPED